MSTSMQSKDQIIGVKIKARQSPLASILGLKVMVVWNQWNGLMVIVEWPLTPLIHRHKVAIYGLEYVVVFVLAIKLLQVAWLNYITFTLGF